MSNSHYRGILASSRSIPNNHEHQQPEPLFDKSLRASRHPAPAACMVWFSLMSNYGSCIGKHQITDTGSLCSHGYINNVLSTDTHYVTTKCGYHKKLKLLYSEDRLFLCDYLMNCPYFMKVSQINRKCLGCGTHAFYVALWSRPSGPSIPLFDKQGKVPGNSATHTCLPSLLRKRAVCVRMGGW